MVDRERGAVLFLKLEVFQAVETSARMHTTGVVWLWRKLFVDATSLIAESQQFRTFALLKPCSK